MAFVSCIVALVSVIMILFAAVIVSHTLQAMALGPNLTKVHSVVAKGAVCLDGSPPAYQLDWGENEGANHWLLHLQGGYWCATKDDCKNRTTDSSGLGSSTKMGNAGFSGILSNKPEFNPHFYNWNRVYVRYCDGSSFTGDKEEPDDGVYYRGGRIFFAIIDELLNLGMDNASGALLSGGSAGGLAAILHCDKFRDLLPPTTNVKCLSDAGFFLTNASGSNNPVDLFNNVVKLHESAMHLPPSCTSKMNASLCFYPTNVVPDIQAPIFLLNSAYDTFEVAEIQLANGFPKFCQYDLRDECPADQLEKWKHFRLEYLQALTKLGNSSTRGLFINSCHTHSQSQFQRKWLGDPDSMLDNMTIAEAVGEWFFDRRTIQLIGYVHDSPQQCVVDHSEPYACNNYTWGNSYLCNNNSLN